MKFHQCDTLLDSNIDTDRNFMLKASYGNNGFIPTHIWVWLQGSHLAPRSPGYHEILRRQGWPVGVPSRVVKGRCRAQAGSDGSYVFLSTSSTPSPPPGARLEGAGLADHPGLARLGSTSCR
jgi:hypothetical protein